MIELIKVKGNDGIDFQMPDFLIGKFPITRKEWAEVFPESKDMEFGDWSKKPNRPVTYVLWFDAIKFCNELSRKEYYEPYYIIENNEVTINHNSNGYRLPTEVEWLFAAKGGLKGLEDNFKYSGSNDLDEVAWYADNSKNRTHKVGKKKPNQLGIFDMSGNVWEWCWDLYESGSPYRVILGGSYLGNPDILRSSRRYNFDPGDHISFLGFRLARSI